MIRARRRPSLLLIAALVLLAAGQARAYVSSSWYEDASGYAEAVRLQKLHHAPMIVYFRVDWCPHCRAFDQLLEDSAMRSKLGQAIKVRINPEHGAAEKQIFEQQFGAKAYPAIFWLGSENDSPRKLSSKGPAEKFLAQLGG